jgi:hypothetical protein
MSVEVDKAGIRRQLRAYEVAFVRLRSSLDAADAVVVFEEALAGCRLDGDRPDFGAMLTPSGPVTMLEEIDRPAVWEWLDQVAAQLSATGVTGSLAAAKSAKPPEVFAQGRVPTAGVVFGSLELPWQGSQRWPLTAEETTTVVNHAAEWCDLGGKQWLGLNKNFWLAGADTRQLAAPMGAAAASTKADLVAATDVEGRKFATAWYDCAAQVVTSHLGWREQVELCRQVLLWEPELVLWAVIGTSEYPSLGQTIALCPTAPVKPVHISEYGLRGTLVNAVQGIQLLTGTHVARAHDLSDWDVTQVSSDRYLVEAHDLTPWFTGDRTDPEVYDKAAHDFGRMLVTPETAAEFGIED